MIDEFKDRLYAHDPLDHDNLISILIAYIVEQDREIEDLKVRIRAIEEPRTMARNPRTRGRVPDGIIHEEDHDGCCGVEK